MSGLITPTNLFKASAILWALLVPGHIAHGLTNVHKGLDAAERKESGLNKEQRRGLIGARNQWDGWNFWGLGLALLNWHYSKTAAPKTPEETMALVVMLAGNLIAGLRYGARGEMGPAIGLSLASILSLSAVRLGA